MKLGIKDRNNVQNTLFRMCWPVFLEMTFVGILANLANIILNIYSPDALTATSSCGQIYTLVGCVFTMLSTGGSILFAPVFGGGKKKECLEIMLVLLVHTIIVSLIMGALCIFFLSDIIVLLKVPQELVEMGREYMTVLLGLCIFSGVQSILTAVYRSMGRMRLIMVNNILQYIVIIAVFLGTLYLLPAEKQSMWQYAMATIYAQIITIIILLVSLKKDNFFCERISGQDFIQMLKRWSGRIYYFGIRAGLAPVIAMVVQIFMIRFLGELGTAAMTARAYAVSLVTYLGLVSNTLTTVCSPLFGQHLGAGKIEELPQLVIKITRINLLLTGLSCVMMLLAGYPLLHIFTADPILLKLAFQVILIDMVWKMICAGTGIATTALKAAGDVNFPFVVSIFAYAINLVVSYVCGITLQWGVVGFWLGFIAAEVVNGGMGILRFRSGKWRRMWEKGLLG